jgi:tetratricopeptide (TPR) repeat protein
MAMAYWLADWNWKAANAEFKWTLELDPTYSATADWYGLFLAEAGHLDEAIATEKSALELDPGSATINADLGKIYFYARRYRDAEAQFSTALRLEPSLKMERDQLQLYEAADLPDAWADLFVQGSAHTAADARTHVRERGIIALRRAAFDQDPSDPERATAYLFSPLFRARSSGELDQAFLELQRAVSSHSPWVLQIKVGPQFDGLRQDPRFKDILSSIDLDGDPLAP